MKGYMSIKITGRHLVITSALRQHVESRFERLVRYDVKLTHLEVILGVSKLQHHAEVVCTMQGRRIQAKASTQEMYATIDQLVDRLATQIRKYKERQTDHKEPVKRLARKALAPVARKEDVEEMIEVICPPQGDVDFGGCETSARLSAWFTGGLHGTVFWEIANSTTARS